MLFQRRKKAKEREREVILDFLINISIYSGD